MERTHVVNIYSPPAEDADPYDATAGAWTLVAEDIAANLEPLTGSVQQAAAGRAIEATWRGFVPDGTVAAEDYGVEVLSGPGAPRRFRIVQWGPLGAGFDSEMLLRQTPEEFTVAA